MSALPAALHVIDATADEFPLPDRPPSPSSVAKQVEALGRSEMLAEDQDWLDAELSVDRAIIRGGRDPKTDRLTTDTRTLRTIAALLSAVRRCARGMPDEALVAAYEQAERVARAIERVPS